MNNVLSHFSEINTSQINYLLNATSEFLARTDAQVVLETSKLALGIFLGIAVLAATIRFCSNRVFKAKLATPANPVAASATTSSSDEKRTFRRKERAAAHRQARLARQAASAGALQEL